MNDQPTFVLPRVLYSAIGLASPARTTPIKIAKLLDFQVPPALLASADEVIE